MNCMKAAITVWPYLHEWTALDTERSNETHLSSLRCFLVHILKHVWLKIKAHFPACILVFRREPYSVRSGNIV